MKGKKIISNIVGFFVLFNAKLIAGPIETLNGMNANECIKYTLEKKMDKKIAVATLSDDQIHMQFYGHNGELLSFEDNKNNLYEIGSLTKTITATLICQAQMEGKLSIEDSINKYLELGNETERFYPSIKSIMTHTSGFKPYYMAKGMSKNHLSGKNDFYGITKQQILSQLEKIQLEKNKKYSFEYSNFGYAVLGLVLESVYGKSYTDIVNDFVQNKLGMKNTHIADGKGNMDDYWDWNSEDGYLSAGALYSTIEDMIIYAKWNLSEEGVFSKSHEMLETAKNSSPMYVKMGINIDEIGYGWILDKENQNIWHNGATGNFNCYVGFNINEKKAVIVLSDISPDYRIPATVVGTKLIKELESR